MAFPSSLLFTWSGTVPVFFYTDLDEALFLYGSATLARQLFLYSLWCVVFEPRTAALQSAAHLASYLIFLRHLVAKSRLLWAFKYYLESPRRPCWLHQDPPQRHGAGAEASSAGAGRGAAQGLPQGRGASPGPGPGAARSDHGPAPLPRARPGHQVGTTGTGTYPLDFLIGAFLAQTLAWCSCWYYMGSYWQGFRTVSFCSGCGYFFPGFSSRG